jgi:catechol 2,3-dioxygenase-like lactoylglutathione lyase family enzyme
MGGMRDTAMVTGLGYLALGVTDLEASTAFYRDACRLEVVERRDDAVFLRGDRNHHWLRLERRDAPCVIRVGFAARDTLALDEVTRRLELRSIPWTLGGNVHRDRVSQSIRFEDIDGIPIELFEEMVTLPDRPPTGIAIDRLLHAVFFVRDVDASRNFWTQVLGFRRSDQVEDSSVYLRCGNRFHHSVGFTRAPSLAGRLDHFAIHVQSLDDVMRMRTLALRHGVVLDHDLVREGTSDAIGIALADPANSTAVEFCTGHARIEDDAYEGRLLMASPDTVDVWSTLPGPVPGVVRSRNEARNEAATTLALTVSAGERTVVDGPEVI